MGNGTIGKIGESSCVDSFISARNRWNVSRHEFVDRFTFLRAYARFVTDLYSIAR